MTFPNSSITGIGVAMIFSFSLAYLFYVLRDKTPFIIGSVFLFFVLILKITDSRSGFAGFLAASLFLFCKYNKLTFKYLYHLGVIFLTTVILLIFLYKPDSSSGRLHIYSISLKILKDNWVSGVGIGKFKTAFNEYQAAYFMQHDIDSKRALVADNTFYAFNDYLQWIIEAGLPGLLLLLLTIYFLIKRTSLLFQEYGNKQALAGAVSALICAATGSLFNYPLYTIPIQFLTLLCIVIILFYPLKWQSFTRLFYFGNQLLRIIYLLVAAFFSFNSLTHFKTIRAEKMAFKLQRTGFNTEAKNEYKKLLSSNHKHGYNYYSYAELLYFSNRLTEAEAVLNSGLRYYTENKLYRLKAFIEIELGKFSHAEKSFLKALYMVPNRMESRYNLMNFYIEVNDTIKAKYWAYSILKMPVKIRSYRTEEMMKATKKLFSGLNED